MGFLFAHRSWAGLLFCAVFASIPAQAARKGVEPPLLSAPFRDAIEHGVANGAYRSLAVGLIDGRRQGAFYFGHRDGAESKPPDDGCLFEIGAVSEVFTGILLAQAAIEGKLRLSDPIEKFLPTPFPFADARTGKITFAQLAVQRSGLPVQPANLFPVDLDDPYADYASEDLLALLAFQRTRADADGEYSYSVLNAGLLGHLLGRVYHAPYGEVLATKVMAPLGMKQVSFADGAGLLRGHARGAKARHWHYGVLAGAAGLRAGVPDLLSFLQRNLSPEDSPLRAALLLARQPHSANSTDQIGLGWNVREKIDGAATWPLVWRASQTAGFASFVGFRTDQQKAIVLLGNAAEDVAALGIAWLGGSMPPPAPRTSNTEAANRLDEYPGLYRIATGSEAVVRSSSNGLNLQLPGEFPRRLHAAGRDVFVADGGVFGVTFIRTLDEITGLVLHASGGSLSTARLSARAPKLQRAPMETQPAAAIGVRGDYRIDEANWVRIAESSRGLTLQWTLGERRSIFAYSADRYADADGAIDVQFRRAANGRVTGVDLDLAGVQREALPLRRTLP